MNAPDHAVRAHAVLSASSAKRWLTCTPSARINEQFPDEQSTFAAYGTAMHELAERCLVSGADAHSVPGQYDHQQREAVQQYIDYVRAIPGNLMVERRLSFERWVEAGFGTCDAVVICDKHLTIVDLKGGVGVKVDAVDNAQLMLYALAAIDAFDPIYGPIDTVKMVIHQPRLDHVDEHELPAQHLYDWADNYVRPRAKLAWEGKGEFVPSAECQFCKARHTCRKRAEEALATVSDMSKGPELTNEELAALYPKLDGIVRWANDLSDYCLAKAEAGTKFAGLKLVEGRSVRKWIDDETRIVEKIKTLGLDPDEFLTTKLVGIGEAEKRIGKKEFASEFNDLIVRPSGKPTLVSATDKRPEISDHATAVSELLSDC